MVWNDAEAIVYFIRFLSRLIAAGAEANEFRSR